MRAILTVLLCLAVAVPVAATFLPLWRTDAWWVRMADFPRLQYTVALVAVLGAVALARPVSRRLRMVLGAMAVAALAFDVAKIGPYFIGAPPRAEACPEGQRLSLMVANVKLENRHAEELLAIVRERDPDLLLALETNAWWNARLARLSDRLPHGLAQITGSYFGMHLLSRWPLSDARAVFAADQGVPALLATVSPPSGEAVRLIGLHPRPPHPGQSSRGRDAQLMWAALEAREAALPVVLAGDLNAVPWERGVERMRRIAGLIDPRASLGFLPTYDAQSWWMAWPLDQVLHQEGLSVTSLEVLPGFGSDHFPVEAELCRRPAGREAPEPEAGDLERARELLEAVGAR